MKTLHTEQYYREKWYDFLKPTHTEYYIDMQNELDCNMRTFLDMGFSDEQLEIIRKVEAQKVADACKEKCYKQMNIVKGILDGSISFGYTTQTQEIRARKEFRQRFEFNCLQLADFKKKYGLM